MRTNPSAMAGYNMVKKLTTTDSHDIDWNNIDWNKVGVSAAEQALNNAADGFVWGSVIGAINGGVEGYQKYEKFNKRFNYLDDAHSSKRALEKIIK